MRAVRQQMRTRSSTSGFRRIAKALVSSPAAEAALEWTEGWLPPLRYLHRRLYEREFASEVPWARRFYGVYDTFEEAIRAAPASKPVGYDNPGAATFMEHSGALLPCDYPVLFWLDIALRQSPPVLDIRYRWIRRHFLLHIPQLYGVSRKPGVGYTRCSCGCFRRRRNRQESR